MMNESKYIYLFNLLTKNIVIKYNDKIILF